MRRSLRSWLWRVPIEEEVEEELAFHLEMRRREGKPLDPADIERVRRTCVEIARRRDREMRLTTWLEEQCTDVRFALRQLRRAPGFAAVAVLTLALGIGANSAIFALADAALLRPLPFDAPADRLVMVWEQARNGFRTMASPAEFWEWRTANRTFESMAGLAAGGDVTMSWSDGSVERIPSQTVSARFFDVLGVTPLAGRTFAAGDAAPGPTVVVIGEALWRRRFAADPAIAGRRIVLNDQAATVIGVVPAAFQLVPPFRSGAAATGSAAGLWVLGFESGSTGADLAHYAHVIGRLRADSSIEAAQSDLGAIAAGLARQIPANDGHGVALEPLRDTLIAREVRLTSTVLLGVVGFVLLMCCANVANLLLARAGMRSRELAVRSALGAGRRRIVRQLLTESLVLAALGGALGAAIGAAILSVAPPLIPAGLLPNAVTLAFDGRIVAFCAAAALLVGVIFGLAPAWQSTGVALVQAFGSDRRITRRGDVLRAALVAGEVAAAVLVLSGAGLLLRTWIALGQVDPGYRADEVLTVTLTLPMPRPGSDRRYATAEGLRQYYGAVESEVAAQPGVARVAWGTAMPMDGGRFGQFFDIAGETPLPMGSKRSASYHMVSPGYFDTLGIAVVHGREFSRTDVTDGPPVAIVSEAFARRYLDGRNPIGTRIVMPLMAFGPPVSVEREIVGVVREVTTQPDERVPVPHLYVPLAQNTWWAASLVVRPAGGRADALIAPVRAAIARVDPRQQPQSIRTLDGIAREATARPRFRAVTVAAFAALALVLAMVGVFGVLACTVQQRTREFGVRIALGAGLADVAGLVLSSAVRVTLAGAVIGVAAAVALGRYLSTLLFGVEPLDPLTFAAVFGLLLLTAAAAAAAPALRASRVDPAIAFRDE